MEDNLFVAWANHQTRAYFVFAIEGRLCHSVEEEVGDFAVEDLNDLLCRSF
jgi:hypothetical protein